MNTPNTLPAHQQFSAEDLAAVDEIFPVGAASGGRYPEIAMKTLNG